MSDLTPSVAPDETDPFLAAHEAAPLDDEPFTDEERAEVEEGEAAFRRGEYDTLENVRRRLLGEYATDPVPNPKPST